jgi:hypothetical protein
MRHMVGPDWRQLFDVVIVQADKPNFFTDRRKYGRSRAYGVVGGGWRHHANEKTRAQNPGALD